MKLTRILLASTLLLFGLTGCIKDKTAIVEVNGEAITKAEYEKIYNEEIKAANNKQVEEYLKDENSLMSLMLKDRLVNELILKAIIEQEFEKRNITVSKDEIAAKKAEIQNKIGSKEKMDEFLRTNGVSNKEFEENLETEIKIDKLIDKIDSSKVTDKEVKDFYNKNKAMFNFPERVRASHILIEVNPAQIKQEIVSQDKKGTLTSDEINKKTQEAVDAKMNFAKEVRAKAAKNPENFAALAKQYSDDKASAEKGGDLGFFDRNAMVKPFSDVAFKLKPGTVSEIVVTDFGYHIIIVTDKAQAGVQPFEKLKDEINVYLTQKKRADALTKLFDGLKASAKVNYVDPDFDINKIENAIKEKASAQAQEQKTQAVK